MNPYITIKKIQEGLYQAVFIGSSKVVCSNYLTPLHCFKTAKEAREYITKNWSELRQYN